MTPCVWRILCLRNSSSVPYFRQPPNLPTAACRNRSVPNAVQLLSVETECPPKVSICPHSALKPKPKPKFGRPLMVTSTFDLLTLKWTLKLQYFCNDESLHQIWTFYGITTSSYKPGETTGNACYRWGVLALHMPIFYVIFMGLCRASVLGSSHILLGTFSHFPGHSAATFPVFDINDERVGNFTYTTIQQTVGRRREILYAPFMGRGIIDTIIRHRTETKWRHRSVPSSSNLPVCSARFRCAAARHKAGNLWRIHRLNDHLMQRW